MKKIFKLSLPILVIAMAIFSAGCSSHKHKGAYDKDSLKIDSVKWSQTDSTLGKVLSVKIYADYPDTFNSKMSVNIARWIRANIGTGTPTDTTRAQKVIDFLGKQMYDSLKRSDDHKICNLEYSAEARMICNGKRFVTYSLETYEYMGGAHGMTTFGGVTFSKKKGEQFGWDLLGDTISKNFRNLLKDGVREYLSVDMKEKKISDEDLCGMLLIASGNESDKTMLENFPLPATPPYLTDKGVAFVYQSYEIAPYAAGLPTFVVPFDKIKPFLSKAALRLIK